MNNLKVTDHIITSITATQVKTKYIAHSLGSSIITSLHHNPFTLVRGDPYSDVYSYHFLAFFIVLPLM